MDCSMPGFLVLHYLPEFAQTHVHWVNDTVQPSHPLSPFSAPAFSLFQHQGLFQWLSSSHQVVKVLSFSISPSNEYSGLISFRNDWLDLLADQGLSRVFSSTTIWKHQFFGTVPSLFIVQLSHPHMITGKTIALIIWIFFGKVMPLLFNTLSSFVIALLPRSKYLLISLLQSPSAVILEPKILNPNYKVLAYTNVKWNSAVMSFSMLLLSHFSHVQLCATP